MAKPTVSSDFALALSLVGIAKLFVMAMNSETPKHGGSGGGELTERVAGVEGRLGVIEKTMVTGEGFQRELGGVRGEIGALRDEMHVGLGALRDEMQVGLGALRQEMHGELGAVRVEIAKIPFETFKWLLALAGIGGAVATAVYNIWFR
jgi:hypothetical protein